MENIFVKEGMCKLLVSIDVYIKGNIEVAHCRFRKLIYAFQALFVSLNRILNYANYSANFQLHKYWSNICLYYPK